MGHENFTKFGDADMGGGQDGWDQGFPFGNPFGGGAEDVSTQSLNQYHLYFIHIKAVHTLRSLSYL